MTPRASNAIEHGSLPYAFRKKNFAALSRTLGFCDLGVHKVNRASRAVEPYGESGEATCA